MPRAVRTMAAGFLLCSWMLACATAVPGGAGRPGRRADAWLHVLRPRSSAVEIATSPSGVYLRPELPLQLHQAPDPSAVSTDIGLDVGGRLLDGGQVDAESTPSKCAYRCSGAAIGRPGLGRAKSPPRQPVELTFGRESGVLPTATGWASGHRGDQSRLWSRR